MSFSFLSHGMNQDKNVESFEKAGNSVAKKSMNMSTQYAILKHVMVISILVVQKRVTKLERFTVLHALAIKTTRVPSVFEERFMTFQRSVET